MTLRGFRLAATAVLLLFPTLAAAEVKSLDKLTQTEVRARLNAAFNSSTEKMKIQKMMAEPQVAFTATPDGIDYSYAGGKPKVVWRYTAAAKLGKTDEDKVADALRKVLTEYLAQDRGGATGPLVSTEDIKVFAAALEVRWEEPNTRPTISAVGAVTAEVGKATTVTFTVADRETPASQLKVAATASDPASLPAERLVVSGTGGDRTLTLTPAAKATGPVTVTIKVTDAGGLTAETSFAVTVTAKSDTGTGTGGIGSGTTGGGYVVVYVWLPVMPQYVPCGCLWFARGGWGLPRYGPYYPTWSVSPVIYWLATAPVAPSRPLAFVSPPDSTPIVGTPTTPQASSVAAQTPERVVTREELVKGKTEQDWVALYDAGFRQYWAGKFAQAAESCAAAAQLKDDARAWYYLAFSLQALGDATGAKAAAQYAAALEFANPSQLHLITDALRNVQGPARDELRQLRAGVGNERTARDLLVSRPKLISPLTPTTVVATGANP